jgi:hypothetical protein
MYKTNAKSKIPIPIIKWVVWDRRLNGNEAIQFIPAYQ